MKRHALTDAQWALIEDIFPKNSAKAGRPWEPHRQIFDGILWILKTGAAWRDLPANFGPWQTVYDRFRRYERDGTLDQIVDHLHIVLSEAGQIDDSLFCIDGSNIRAHRCAGGAKKTLQL